jgi:hypothetical protein
VEAYRERWQVTDPRRALGAELAQSASGERSAVERLAVEVRGLERGRPGRELEPPSLGLGR